jgi:hypothetical protein
VVVKTSLYGSVFGNTAIQYNNNEPYNKLFTIVLPNIEPYNKLFTTTEDGHLMAETRMVYQ